MDRIMQMKRNTKSAKSIFQEIGTVNWTSFDAFAVKTKPGGIFLLSPNSDKDTPTIVHIDEIEVPELLRRQGVATKALTALCQLADKYQFRLEGGPIGFGETLWRDKFVEWVLSFGFEPDLSPSLPRTNNQKVFYVQRLPR
jgi:hypothetical protein